MSKHTGNSHSKKKEDKLQPKISNFFQKRPPDSKSCSAFTGIAKKPPALKENGVGRKTIARIKANRRPSTSSDDCIPPTPTPTHRPSRCSGDESSGSPGDIIPPTPQVPWVRRSARAICQELSPNGQPAIDPESSDCSIILDSPHPPPSKVSLIVSRLRRHESIESNSSSLSTRKRDLSDDSQADSISNRIRAKRTKIGGISRLSRSKLEPLSSVTSSSSATSLSDHLDSSSIKSDVILDNTIVSPERVQPIRLHVEPEICLPSDEMTAATDQLSTEFVVNESGVCKSGASPPIPGCISVPNTSKNVDDSIEDSIKERSFDVDRNADTIFDSATCLPKIDVVELSTCEAVAPPDVRSPKMPDVIIPEKSSPNREPSPEPFTSENTELDVLPQKSSTKNSRNEEKDFSDYNWDDDFEFPTTQELAKVTPVTVDPTLTADSVFVDDCQRHLVTSVSSDAVSGEPELTIVSERDRVERRCLLRGFWSDTKVSAGDTVNLLSVDPGDAGSTVVIDDDNDALLVVQPDFLVSGTTVVANLFCPRKAVLGEWFRGVEPGNAVMFIGSLVHQLFQTSVSSHVDGDVSATSPAALGKLLERLLRQPQYLTDRYVNRAQFDDARLQEQLQPLVKQVSVWAGRHLNAGQRGGGAARGSVGHVEVVAVHDIEENIWSPRFGIKGKVDMTTEVRVDGEEQTRILPLELKTGRSSFSTEHEGQVQLYSMVSGDRRQDPGEGLLLYIRDGRMKRVPAKYRAGLVQLRNSVSRALSRPLLDRSNACDGGDGGETADSETGSRLHCLPAASVSSSTCQRCPHLTTCSIYHRKVDPVDAQHRVGFDELTEQSTSYLGEQDVAYFLRWVTLLFLEKHHSRSEVGHLWLLTARKREEQGECLSDMRLVPACLPTAVENNNVASAFLHRFSRAPEHWNGERPLPTVGLSASQYVIVSVEERRLLALTMGTIQAITADHLDVLLDKNLYSKPDLANVSYRIDSYSSQMNDGVCFSNMALLLNNEDHCSRLRKFVVDLQPPVVRKTLSKDVILKCRDLVRELNSQQQRAVFSALMTDDYLLIRGFPGSGKSSTLVVLVQVLVALGHTVLLASHTHMAVDNLLLKLKRRGVPFVRLGKAARADPTLHEHTEEVLMRGAETVDDVSKIFGAQVIASTCLGIRHNVLRSRDKFDYCIVDEATQIVEPAVLGPLLHCRRFVLVGDPHQLPPVVRNEAARRGGMDQSLFVRLDRPEATRELSIQYRMNSEIVHLANLLSYGEALRCANEQVAGATLRLPAFDAAEADAPWVRRVLSGELTETVLFLNTDRLPPDTIVGGSGKLANEVECQIVMTIVRLYLRVGLSAEQLGVISPFRDQVAHIRRNLQLSDGGCSDVEVNTVDQYQGRDKDVIVISCVKNPSAGEGVGILSDKRRVNVAITRARHKLILIGSRQALLKHEPMAVVLDSLRNDQVIVLLPGASVGSFCS